MVQIFTDTAANLPMKLLEEYGIRTVPLSYEVDGVEPDYSIEFNGPAFYEAMRRGASVKTSMVNPEQAARAIEESLQAGMDVLYLGISGGISGSCWGVGVQCRELEEKYGSGRIAVLDTRGASLGEGLVVIETARLAKEGRSLGELKDFAKSRCARMQQFFVVDDLKYLHKGGRISGGARLAGTLLQVKPILRGNEEGKIVVYDKVRGKKKALEALAEIYDKTVDDRGTPIGIAHADAPADALHLHSAIVNTLNVKSIFTSNFWYSTKEEESSGISWSTIIFIAGMMIMVEGMAKAGFFRWLCLKLAKLVKYKTIPLFISFMIMSAFLAMFIDSITVILFLAAVTVELAKLLKFNPVPMILSEIFCANLGGSATMCGDPPNIIIGTSFGYSFSDFLTNTGLIAGISLIIVVLYFFLFYRKELMKGSEGPIDPGTLPDPKDAITNKKEFIAASVIFGCAVVLLVTHAQTHLTVSFIGAVIAIITLLVFFKDAPTLLKKVDYKTLLFFVGLFMVVGGLEQTGILVKIAHFIEKVSGGNLMVMVAIIIWVSAFASAFVDNIPFAATMVPVIRNLAATIDPTGSMGVLHTLAWTLSMGTDIGGSATPIGASANVVGTSVAAKNGHIIGWGKYCKVAAPATIIVVLISMIAIFIRYC